MDQQQEVPGRAGGKILLARPHPPLVDGIAAALERNGYRGLVVHSTDEIRRLSWNDIEGAIVSAAAASEIGAALPEVFAALQRAQPDAQIAVTTLMEADYAASSLTKSLQAIYGECELVPVASSIAAGSADRRRVLLITRNDLADEHALGLAIRRHFQRRRQPAH